MAKKKTKSPRLKDGEAVIFGTSRTVQYYYEIPLFVCYAIHGRAGDPFFSLVQDYWNKYRPKVKKHPISQHSATLDVPKEIGQTGYYMEASLSAPGAFVQAYRLLDATGFKMSDMRVYNNKGAELVLIRIDNVETRYNPTFKNK